MQYYIPVRLYAEENCVAAHAREICALGRRAFLITGKSSAEKNGSLDDVRSVLENAGLSYVHFNEIEENPSVETVMKARDIGVRENVDFVIGIGGGSPMDAAKAIALMIRHKDRDASYLYEEGDNSALPLVMIPTTCGTGSEMTAVSVLTRKDLGTKLSMFHKIFADYALLDGKYISRLPKQILADTTMDALAHCVESYINTSATPYTRMCADAGMRLWSQSRDIVLGNREALPEDYLNMLNTAAIAGMSIVYTATTIPHGLSYAVTYHTKMPHGRACGLFLPGYLRESPKEDVCHVLNLSGFSSIDELESYFRETSHPEKPSAEALEYCIQDMLRNPGKLAKVPFRADETVLRRIADGC